ncbi:hypothetical protein EMIHUDRAFT_218791 [Emiliania huxleyi CCMP1516]|uniref:Uncharacterized protein n=2 Tax=Emiliania huxleyi TaxID=2903 RepID=A0A0D3I663_EMIH1|nr:hypothetical protein EMIHUDRAFT_218791 [Emiliania huxleyi CCMP1516]EOD06748.1 hypothetical protein EMIHUDRAFT_218791 [Emiliania huxleyi CCMP1516]|eukprot:XP_005759177.1 hypothetical protein EMIHUDRAFT_218791 [Emiliania huxleyi CCMP1516]
MIAALPALAASHAVLSPLRPLAPQQITMALDQKANAMFDTVDARDKRPDFITSLETRDKLTAAFLVHGVVVSGLNVIGLYDRYEYVAIGMAGFIGLTSAAVGWYELCAGITEDDDRPGFAHERAIMLYTTSYLAGVMWLSLRFSPLYPASLVPLDNLLCAVSILVYLYGLVSPAATLVCLREQLTPTEVLRMKGMVVSGLVGSVFLLETTALLLHEADWWGHVTARYPAQSVLEPSVTVFAAYAVEAGVFIHRLARRGVVTFADAVPFYGKVLLPLLTLLPMACLFAYRHDEVSFWEFLFLDWE